jgi:hypothetical protein
VGPDEEEITFDDTVEPSVCDESVRDPVLESKLLDDIGVEGDKVEVVSSVEARTEVSLVHKLLVGRADAEVERKLVEVELATEALAGLVVFVVSEVLELIALLSEVDSGTELLDEVDSMVEVLIELLVDISSDVGEPITLLLADIDTGSDELVELLAAKVKVEDRLEEPATPRHCPSRPAGTASGPLPMAISSEPQTLALAK